MTRKVRVWDWCGFHGSDPMVSWDPGGPPYCWVGYWRGEADECASVEPIKMRIMPVEEPTEHAHTWIEVMNYGSPRVVSRLRNAPDSWPAWLLWASPGWQHLLCAVFGHATYRDAVFGPQCAWCQKPEE